jgi:hypothetical protein
VAPAQERGRHTLRFRDPVIVPEEPAHVLAAAVRHFVSEQRQRSRCLVQEVLGRLHEEAPRVIGPLRGDALIDRRGLLG